MILVQFGVAALAFRACGLLHLVEILGVDPVARKDFFKFRAGDHSLFTVTPSAGQNSFVSFHALRNVMLKHRLVCMLK